MNQRAEMLLREMAMRSTGNSVVLSHVHMFEKDASDAPVFPKKGQIGTKVTNTRVLLM